MIDPITIGAAFAVAKTSVSFVKEAINLGHDIGSCYDELSKFFVAQGQIEKAAIEAEKAKTQEAPKDADGAQQHKTALEQAFTIVMHRKQMREFERELRDMFSMKGEMALYQELCEERQRIIGEDAEAAREKIRKERLEKDIEERHSQERREAIETAFVVILAIVLIIGLTIGTCYVISPDSVTWIWS